MDSEIISDSERCAEIMINLSSDAAINFDINSEVHTENTACDYVTIEKYKNHHSIQKIKEKNFQKSSFVFQNQNMTEVFNNLDSTKSFKNCNNPQTILKDNKGICSIMLTSDIIRYIIKVYAPLC